MSGPVRSESGTCALIDAFRTMETGSAHPRMPLGHPAADNCLKGGLLCGALHEVFAADAGSEAAASGFAMGLSLCVSRGKKLLWIRQDFSSLEFGELSATGFLELGLDPDRVLLLRVCNIASALRAAGEGLSCAALGAVVIEIPGASKYLDLVTSRRLTLAAARKGVSAFLLRLSAQPAASAAETRWLVGPVSSSRAREDWGFPVFTAALARNRHGATGNWTMEWNSDEHGFRESAADSGAMVSLSGDRPPLRQTAA